MGFRVSDLEIRFSGFRIWGFGFRASCLGCSIWGWGFKSLSPMD